MKKLFVVLCLLAGVAVFALPPPRGPHGPGPRGPHGCPPPPPGHYHDGSDGLHDAAAITSIVANGMVIANQMGARQQVQAPAQTTVVVQQPAPQTTVVTQPAPQTTVVTQPAPQTTVVTQPAPQTTVVTR